MITDRVPKAAGELQEYRRSEAMLTIQLPPKELFREHVQLLERCLKEEDKKQVQLACNAIAQAVASSFGVKAPKVAVLGVRPLEESGRMIHELYGDYTFETERIRLWMRTAVREKAT